MDIVHHTAGKFTIDDTLSIPIYYMDGNSLIEAIPILPKSEGIVYKNGRIYISLEYACNKYFLGKFIACDYIYSITTPTAYMKTLNN